MSGNCVFEVRTVQVSVIKTLIEALKDLLTDTTVDVTPSGIRLIATDTAMVVLVNLRLYSDRFEFYKCAEERVRLGVNMMNLHRLVKTCMNSDTLTLFMEEDDRNRLGIRIDSSEKNTKTVYKLNLLTLPQETITVGPTQFDDVIVLNSQDFQKMVRDMNTVAENVDIRVVRDEVTLCCKGDFCAQETVLINECVKDTTLAAGPEHDGRGGHEGEESSDVMTQSIKGAEDITQGQFSLRHLVLFTRCTNLSNYVELFMKNDFPLIVRYNVSTLGDIKLVVAPQLDD
jgi:proliferating cell nuclear antigen